MKSVKFLLPLLLLCAVLFCGCTGKEEKKIDEVVKRELDLLKHLDSDTTQKYISYQEAFVCLPWMPGHLPRIFPRRC